MIWVYGSINIDHVYRVPHLVAPGETLAATGYGKGLGGKGANQSIAAARAGAKVRHIGAVGDDGLWTLDHLRTSGIETELIAHVSDPTGNAIIQVDDAGENAILLLSGANSAIPLPDFSDAQPGDWLMLQNEANDTAKVAKTGKGKGMRVAYSAAPFQADAVRDILPHIDLLLCNSVENAALETELGEIAVQRIVTHGDQGAEWVGTPKQPAFHVEQVVDTTGAGDCFAGYLIASLDAGMTPERALRRAIIAGALQVTKKGAADAMPFAADVDRLI